MALALKDGAPTPVILVAESATAASGIAPAPLTAGAMPTISFEVAYDGVIVAPASAVHPQSTTDSVMDLGDSGVVPYYIQATTNAASANEAAQRFDVDRPVTPMSFGRQYVFYDPDGIDNIYFSVIGASQSTAAAGATRTFNASEADIQARLASYTWNAGSVQLVTVFLPLAPDNVIYALTQGYGPA